MIYRTVTDVATYIFTRFEKHVSDQDIVFGLAKIEASNIIETFNTSDMASLLIEGLEPFNVENWLSTYYESYDDDEIKSATEDLELMFDQRFKGTSK